MPIRKTGNKYYWGSKGPFDSRKKAEEVAQAAHASGYEGSIDKAHELHGRPSYPAVGGIDASEHHTSEGKTDSGIHQSVEKIWPVVGAALGVVGRVALGAAGKGLARGALGVAGRGLAGSALTGGGSGGGGGEEDAGVDPGQAHAEEEWNLAGRDDPNTAAIERSLLKLMEKDTPYMNDPNWTPDDEVGLQYSERQSRKDKAMSLPNYEALRTHQAFSREGERDNTYPSAVGDYARESIPNFPIGTKETRPLHPYNIGYDPKTLRRDKAYREAKVRNLQNLYKEGDGGGAFNGLSDTVFTSSHAGIFTPTFGERGTKRRHRKNKRNQDAKRKKLMGEDKKNGLDRLVQFLQEGSPRLHKRQPDKMMTGQFQSIHVDRQTPRKQIDWRKKRVNKELEKTTEEINWKKRQEGISEDKEYPNMSADTGSLATSSTYPGGSEATWTGTKSVAKAPDWNKNNTMVQKQDEEYHPGDEYVTPPGSLDDTRLYHHEPEREWEFKEDKYEDGQRVVDPETGEVQTESRFEPAPTSLSGGTYFPQEDIEDYTHRGFTHEPEDSQTMHGQSIQNDIEKAGTHMTNITPLTSQNSESADGPHPQRAFTEKTPSKELRQQVVDQNDFETRVKSYDSKEDEKGNVDQPRAVGAAKSMMDYPNSNMQMMEKAWGSGPDTFAQDALHRGGDKDEEDVDIEDDKEDDSHDWIPEDENKVKAEKEWLDKFQLLHKSFVRGGDATPVLSAILALDNE